MIRPAEERDLPEIARCEALCFPLPLSPASVSEMFQNPLYRFLTAHSGNTFTGHALLCLAGDDAEILSVAVLPEFRRQGFGKQLLDGIEALAKEKNVRSMILEARVSNLPAISLYESTGFQKIALRKNFYTTPPEDGITMIKNIKGPDKNADTRN